jgi:hypothetical protein
VASTIDGQIAGPDGQFDFFPFEPGLSEYVNSTYPETVPTGYRTALGIDAPNARYDALVMGRGTYEPALKMGVTSPYAHLKQRSFRWRSLPGRATRGVRWPCCGVPPRPATGPRRARGPRSAWT